MSIRRRREQSRASAMDVQWRLPDRSKRKKTFSNERGCQAIRSQAGHQAAPPASPLDPRGGQDRAGGNGFILYRILDNFRAPTLSAKVRRGYEDNWRLRIQPRLWQLAESQRFDHESIQAVGK